MMDVNLTGEARKTYMETVAKKSVNLTEDERKAFVNVLMRESVQATEAKPNRVYSQRGDDYLIEAQKVCAEDKPKPPVVCPYCGHKMTHWCVYGDHYYRCPKCHAVAPDKATEDEAYEAAMQRWLEPNRVLTLEEVREHCKQGADAAPLWVEFHKDPSVSRWMVVYKPEVFAIDMVKYYLTSFGDGYDWVWRCWLRKPTQEEREATPWEEEHAKD